VLDQLAFADFVERGEFDRHLRRMRPLYKRRRDTLIDALAEKLPDLEPTGIAAGLHLVAYLPSDLDEKAVVDVAARRRIAAYGLAQYQISSEGRQGLVFGYATPSERTIVEGIETLADAIAEVRSHAPVPMSTVA
jgi:GntR family transcriptional regulator/MocR family aminotransferase